VGGGGGGVPAAIFEGRREPTHGLPAGVWGQVSVRKNKRGQLETPIVSLWRSPTFIKWSGGGGKSARWQGRGWKFNEGF